MRRGSQFLTTLALVLVACAGDSVGPDAGSDPGGGSGGALPGSIDPQVASFSQMMNAHRESVGCGTLTWHDGTGEVAQAHSEDMLQRDFFSHTNPDGDDPFDRLDNAGVTWIGAAGENIALTPDGAESALDLWLDSSGHRANIENCAYSHHGIGLSGGYWTHVFITNPAP
jgi:uncharacterized protein YkwD